MQEETKAAATVRAAVEACGPVVLSTEMLRSPRAFKHAPNPLAAHLAAFAAATGASSERMLKVGDRALVDLTERFLLPLLSAKVRLHPGAYNPAFARFVDGLTDNEEALESGQVEVGASTVADCLLALPSEPDLTYDGLCDPSERPSVLTAGSAALEGRMVTLTLDGPQEQVSGLLLRIADGMLMLLSPSDGSLRAVPLGKLLLLETRQLVRDEDDLLFGRS